MKKKSHCVDHESVCKSNKKGNHKILCPLQQQFSNSVINITSLKVNCWLIFFSFMQSSEGRNGEEAGCDDSL